MKRAHLFYTFIGTMALILPAYSASIFSKYGVIQNVQNYSTNPAYNPDSPYNNRLPSPVYAMGPQVGTDDCQQVVADLIAITCAGMNNCANAELSDVRPSVMVQLSRITTGNYATSCGGYIDGAFNDYVAKYGRTTPQMNVVAFPTPNNNSIQPIQIKNPFAPQAPDWAVEVQDKKQELQNLQSQNGTNKYGITAAAFPTTYADLSFTERMENEKIGYEPYKDVSAFDKLNIESKKEYLTRQKELAQEELEFQKIQDKKNLSHTDFCKKYPSDTDCTQNNNGGNSNGGNNNNGDKITNPEKQQLINKIISAFPK